MFFNENILVEFSSFLERGNLKYLSVLDGWIENQYEKSVKRIVVDQIIHEEETLVQYREIYEGTSQNVKDGKYFKTYYPFRRREIANYKDNMKNGEYKEYSLDGELILEGNYENDKKNGDFIEYKRDGSISKVSKYLNDLLMEEIIYDDTWGKIHNKFKYKDGKLVEEEHSSKIRNAKKYYDEDYDEDGNSKVKAVEISDFINGIEVKNITFYNKKGNVIKSRNYRNNILDGKAVDYYESGRMKIVANYSNGLLDGFFYTFYDNDKGNADIHAFYENGKLNGHLVKYYENPQNSDQQLMVSSMYRDDLLNGEYIEYDRSGNIVLKENYENGRKVNL